MEKEFYRSSAGTFPYLCQNISFSQGTRGCQATAAVFYKVALAGFIDHDRRHILTFEPAVSFNTFVWEKDLPQVEAPPTFIILGGITVNLIQGDISKTKELALRGVWQESPAAISARLNNSPILPAAH